MIVKKMVDTAESIDTILVGDDTDLLVLLIFHAQDIFFVLEPKKIQKLGYGIKRSLDQYYANTSSSYMLSLDVIPPHKSMGSEKVH